MCLFSRWTQCTISYTNVLTIQVHFQRKRSLDWFLFNYRGFTGLEIHSHKDKTDFAKKKKKKIYSTGTPTQIWKLKVLWVVSLILLFKFLPPFCRYINCTSSKYFLCHHILSRDKTHQIALLCLNAFENTLVKTITDKCRWTDKTPWLFWERIEASTVPSWLTSPLPLHINTDTNGMYEYQATLLLYIYKYVYITCKENGTEETKSNKWKLWEPKGVRRERLTESSQHGLWCLGRLGREHC